jgi:EAL domain-containing protein (putative c-di-GMP-specific phosphodiesterase class I)
MKYFFNKTYTINNFKLILNCNFGIEIYPKDEKNIEKLLNFAYIALKEAKNEGINRYKFYNNELFIQIKSKKEAIALIEEALKNNEFILFYQPQIETKSQKIIGAESLLRIKKDNKIIQPYKFINEIEKSDYIYEINKIILNNIEKIIEKTNLNISFNLSFKSFNNRKITNKIIEIGQKYPNKLEIELLERSLIQNTEYSKKILNKFKENNILIAIDDFGTGYSSLNYIMQFPVDILKIDLSFIQTMLTNQTSFIIVKTIINFSKELNIKTIAEGVENKDEFLILKTLRCDYIQGYYFYKPMDKKDFLKSILT